MNRNGDVQNEHALARRSSERSGGRRLPHGSCGRTRLHRTVDPTTLATLCTSSGPTPAPISRTRTSHSTQRPSGSAPGRFSSVGALTDGSLEMQIANTTAVVPGLSPDGSTLYTELISLTGANSVPIEMRRRGNGRRTRQHNGTAGLVGTNEHRALDGLSSRAPPRSIRTRTSTWSRRWSNTTALVRASRWASTSPSLTDVVGRGAQLHRMCRPGNGVALRRARSRARERRGGGYAPTISWWSSRSTPASSCSTPRTCVRTTPSADASVTIRSGRPVTRSRRAGAGTR